MTNDELLARIENIEEDACWYQQSDGQCDDMHSVIRSLRAVVEREERDPKFNINSWAEEYSHGYNQCLADVKADIAKELG